MMAFVPAPRALMPLLLLGVTVGFYWKVTLSSQFSWRESPEIAFRTLPTLDFEAREVRCGRLGLWDLHRAEGGSLLARIENGAANPLLLPLFSWRLRDGKIRERILDWHWTWLHWLSLVSAYVLCRGMGASRTASVLGAAAYALSGVAGSALTPQRLSAAVWIPLALLMTFRSPAIGGAAVGLAWLSGDVQAALAVTAVSLFAWVRAPLGLVIAALVGAGQLVPWIMYGGATWPVDPRAPWWCIVPGALAVALAAAGLASQWKRREVKLLGAVALFAVGTSGWLMAAQAALAALAALGLDGWPGWRRRSRARLALLWTGIAILSTYVVLGVARVPVAEERPAMTGLAALLAAGVLYAWDRGGLTRRHAAALLLAVVLLEAGVVSTLGIPQAGMPKSPLRTMAEQGELADYLKRQEGWQRVATDPAQAPYDFGRRFGVEQAGAAPDVFGLTHYIGTKPSHDDQVAVFEAAGLTVFRDKRRGPLRVERSEPCAAQDELRVARRTASETIVEARLACPGTLAMGDAWSSAWRLRVDGRPAELLRLAGGVRGVALGAGPHRVELRYRPIAIYAGIAMSVVGLLLAAVFVKRHA